MKRLLHRVIRGLIGARLLGLLVGALLVVGAAVLVTQALPPQGMSFSLPGSRRAPASTENYLKGNQNFDASLVWSSLSDDAIERLRARGRSPQDTQDQLERARASGTSFEAITYVGGYSLNDGTSMQFYVVATKGQTSRPEVEYVPYIFTLDRAGKIARVQ